MAEKIVLKQHARRFTVTSNEIQRSVVISIASRLCEMGATDLAQTLVNLDSLQWKALCIALCEESHSLFRAEIPQSQAKLTELRISRGLSRGELVQKLQGIDRTLKISELSLVHLETSAKRRREANESCKTALSSYFRTDWETLSQPISTK